MVDDVTQTDAPAEHRFLRLTEEEAEMVLSRSWRPNVELCTRGRILRIIAKKVRDRLLVPTKANARYHIYIEMDLLTYQAARSIFFDWTRWNPVFTAGSRTVRVSFAARTHHHTATFLRLHDGHEMGIGPGIFRKRGQTFVMGAHPVPRRAREQRRDGGHPHEHVHHDAPLQRHVPVQDPDGDRGGDGGGEGGARGGGGGGGGLRVGDSQEEGEDDVRQRDGSALDEDAGGEDGRRGVEDYLSTGDEMSDESGEESERSEQSE